MIHDRDLRPGNWVLRKGKPVQVSSIDIAFGRAGKYEPIRLTEEILVKTHMVPHTKGDEKFYSNQDNILIRLADMSLFMHSDLDGSVFYVRYLIYLHELQNLYYFIDKIELEVAL